MRKIVLAMCCVLLASCTSAKPPRAAPPVTPLVHAHAHNDYEHARPLADALDCGFCSVEADIHLVNGQLLVAHDLKNTRPDRTLESLYLEPLRQRVRANGGRVYRDGPSVTLLIDFKSPAETMYPVLRDVLERFRPMLTTYADGKTHEGAVTVILTGDRPTPQSLAEEPDRLVAIDGHFADLGRDDPPSLVPWISGDWKKMFRWTGKGTMPAAERDRLDDLVAKAHAKGRLIRFWDAPDTEPAWSQLRAAGVDLINTDNLTGLRDFFATSAPR